MLLSLSHLLRGFLLDTDDLRDIIQALSFSREDDAPASFREEGES
jgi:hypothetical protein